MASYERRFLLPQFQKAMSRSQGQTKEIKQVGPPQAGETIQAVAVTVWAGERGTPARHCGGPVTGWMKPLHLSEGIILSILKDPILSD